MSALNSPQIENFEHVRAQYRLNRRCEQLGPVLKLSVQARDRLFRAHQVKPVYKKEEIRARARMDGLLHACSILEIGLSANVLADTDDFGRRKLLPFLSDPPIQAYYQERYSIALPRRYCARLMGWDCDPYEGDNYAWFARLLALNHEFRDKRLDEFLLIVDGFYIEGFKFHDLEGVVKDKKFIAVAFVTPEEKRSIGERAVVGLYRFLLFCEELEKVLTSDSRSDARLSDLAFELYRYWFAVRGGNLRSIVDRTLKTLNELEQQKELPERQAMLRLFERGALPPPGHILPEVKRATEKIKHKKIRTASLIDKPARKVALRISRQTVAEHVFNVIFETELFSPQSAIVAAHRFGQDYGLEGAGPIMAFTRRVNDRFQVFGITISTAEVASCTRVSNLIDLIFAESNKLAPRSPITTKRMPARKAAAKRKPARKARAKRKPARKVAAKRKPARKATAKGKSVSKRRLSLRRSLSR